MSEDDKLKSLTILVTYRDIIKTADFYILDLVKTRFRDKFKDLIDFKLLDTLTEEALMFHWLHRPVKNILEWLAIKEFDYEKNYQFLYDKSKKLYIDDNRTLKFDKVLENYKFSKAINDIYVWNPTYDKRQLFDLKVRHGLGKIKYVTGASLERVLDRIGSVNLIYDTDADRVAELINTGKYPKMVFGVGAYGYNYQRDFILKHDLADNVNVSTFPILIINESYLFNG